MGWAYGENSKGRPIGYGVEAVCDEPGCDEKIDRGLYYHCGGSDASAHIGEQSEVGCGGYFCDSHLFMGSETGVQNCQRCYVEEDEEALASAGAD